MPTHRKDGQKTTFNQLIEIVMSLNMVINKTNYKTLIKKNDVTVSIRSNTALLTFRKTKINKKIRSTLQILMQV